MEHARKGSVLIMVMLLMTGVMICITNTWHSSFYASDIARKRQVYEQRFRATEGLINYAVAVCKDNWQELSQQGDAEGVLRTEQWPCGDNGNYSGQVILAKTGSVVHIHAQLLTQEKIVFAIRCLVRAVSDEQGLVALSVEGWRCETL